MMKHLAIILLLVSTVLGQQRVRPIDLTPETLTLIADSAQAAISRNPGFTLDANSKAVVSSSFLADSLVAADTTALKLRKGASDGAMIYLAGLSATNANGGGWFVYGDSAYAEGGVAFGAVVNGKQWVRKQYASEHIFRSSWFGVTGDSVSYDTEAMRYAISEVKATSEHGMPTPMDIYLDTNVFLNDSILIPRNVRIIGNYNPHLSFWGRDDIGTGIFLDLNDSTRDAIIYEFATKRYNDGTSLKNLFVSCLSPVRTAVVANYPSSTNAMHNVRIVGFDIRNASEYYNGTDRMKIGLSIMGGIVCSFENIIITYADSIGVTVLDEIGTSTLLSKFYVTNSPVGMYIEDDVRIENSYFEDCDSSGIYILSDDVGVELDNIDFEGVENWHIYAKKVQQLSVSNCRFISTIAQATSTMIDTCDIATFYNNWFGQYTYVYTTDQTKHLNLTNNWRARQGSNMHLVVDPATKLRSIGTIWAHIDGYPDIEDEPDRLRHLIVKSLDLNGVNIDSTYEAATNDTLYYRIEGTSRWYYMLVKP